MVVKTENHLNRKWNTHHSIIFWRVIAWPNCEKIKQGSNSENTNCIHTNTNITNQTIWSSKQSKKKKIEKEKRQTPFKSFLPWAGKILTYLEAIRNPRKHMVNTFAIGKTAILIVAMTDWPPAASTSDRNLAITIFFHRISKFSSKLN